MTDPQPFLEDEPGHGLGDKYVVFLLSCVYIAGARGGGGRLAFMAWEANTYWRLTIQKRRSQKSQHEEELIHTPETGS